MQFKEVGSLFENGELAAVFNGGGLKSNNFKTASSVSDMQNITAEMFNKQFHINTDGISEWNKSQIEAKANAIGLTDSLKDEVLAMASDATMTDKLKTGKMTWKKAIADSGEEIDAVADALKNSGKISDEWISRLDKCEPKNLKQNLLDCVNEVDGLANSFTSLEEVEKTATSSLGDGFKGMLVSLKSMLPVIAAVGAAVAAWKIFEYTQTGYTRATEQMNKSVQSYKEEQQNLDDLNSKLDETKSRIQELKELQANGTITFAEETELEKLQNTNTELERQIELQQQLVDIKQQKAVNDTEKAANTQQSWYEYNKEKYGFWGGLAHYFGGMQTYATDYDKFGNPTNQTSEYLQWKEQNNNDTTISGQLKGNIKLLEEQQNKLKKLQSANNANTDASKKQQQALQDQINETKSAMSEEVSVLQGYIDNVTDSSGNIAKGAESSVREWKSVLNEYSNIGKTKNEKYLSNLENYFSSSKAGSTMKDYLTDLAKDGKSAEEALEAFRASGMRLKDIGVSENAFKRYFEDIKKSAQEANEAIKSTDGTFDGLKAAAESANQGANYDTTMGYYKTAKEMYEKGLVGTDDFKSMAQFGVNYDIAKKLKDNADAYTYASDAYVEAWKQSQELLERWYGNEDELTNMQNVLEDFTNAGLASSVGEGEWTFKNDDGSMKFKTTAEAAEKLKTSVSNVELAMSKLEEHGFEFDGIEKSGELLSNYKTNLDSIKDIYDSMEEGSEKDRLKKLIEGYDSEYEKFQDDLSGLSQDQVVKIKFEYDLASIQQKVQELKDQAEASGSNQDWAATRVAQQQERGLLEEHTGISKDSDEGYAASYDKIDSLQKQISGASEKERASLNSQISAVETLQNAWLQFKADGGQLDWNSFLDTPTATALFNDLVEKGTLTEEQIKLLFGDSITCNIEAKLNDDNLQKKLASLKADEKITFEADVDNLDNAQVEAVKNQDGTITYTANVGGVPEEVNKITEQDGTIRFTTEFDGSVDWINNNLQNGETITYKADVSGVQKDIEAYKDEDGTIHYYSIMDDGSKQDLMQQTDENGTIIYVPDTSKVESAVKDVENEKPEVEVELTADQQKVQDAFSDLLNNQVRTTFIADADFSNVQTQIENLEVGNAIVFTANVDGVDQAVAAVKYQDGSIGYVANVDGVYYQLSTVQNTDGTVSYTIGDYPTEVPVAQQTINRLPDNSQILSNPSSVNQTAKRTADNSGITSAPTIFQKVIRFFTGGDQLVGTAHASGTLDDTSWVNNSWKTSKNEVALTGEVGQELVVSGNKWFTTGDNGAQFTSIPAGSVVFNSKQTEELLNQGFTNSRAKGNPTLPGLPAFLSGSAYASGGRLPSKTSSSSSSAKKKTSSSSSSNSSSKSSSNSGSSSNSNNSNNSSSSDSSTEKETENLVDFIKILYDRVSRLADLAEKAIDRAVGLVNKQSKATDAIDKVRNEISTAQQAANKYLEYANQVSLSEDYKQKIREGNLSIENITDEDTKNAVSKYQDYWESYQEYSDKVLDLEDKLTDLAEKRLSIIEDEYNAIEDIQTSLQDRYEADRDLLEKLGTSIDSRLNTDSIKNAITSQAQVYDTLTKKLSDYQAEVQSQLNSGLMKKGSEQWYDAQKNINDFTANIAKASSELIDSQDKLRQINYDALQYVIDGFSRSTDKISAYIDLLEAKDEKVPESEYQKQLDNNNAAIQNQYKLRNQYLAEQAYYDVSSPRYQELAKQINEADVNILNLEKDNEDLKDSIYSLRIKPLEDAIQKYADLEDELSNFRDLLNDDAFLDKQGGITDEGLAQIALLSQSLGNAKQKISDYTTGLQKIKELYENGVISLDEYNDKTKEYRDGIQDATKDVKSYQDSLTDLYLNAMQTEVDYLDEIISKRQKALETKKSYYEYDKKIKSQTKDIDSLKAQIQALEGVNNLSTQSQVKKLKAQLKDAEDELADTKRDHEYDMRSQGYDQLSDDLKQMIEDTTYDLNHSADKRLEVINSMLDKEVGSYQEAFNKINSIISNTGFVGSNDFNNNQNQLSSQTGASSQKENATKSQTESNKKPSSAAAGTDTSGLKDNSIENDRITQDILKSENTAHRKVAELKVDKTSVSVQEGSSASVSATIRPNDAENKTLSWKSSNDAVATVSSGTIKGIKPGSCTVTVSTTDGSGLSQSISVTVTKKPEPPKPTPAQNTNGKDGILRVGDTATLSGRYYYDSWGVSPAGSRYAGVKDGVIVDSYSAGEFGGNAKRTGDYKVHIGGTDGVYKDLGWVRPDQLSGYKDGIERVPYNQIAQINEGNKDETIVTPEGHTLKLLTKNSSVLKNEAQRNLWEIANNPQLFAEKILNSGFATSHIGSFGESISGIKMPTVENNNQQNITIEQHYDSLLTVNGNVDKDALPGLKEILRQASEQTRKDLAKELKNTGYRITR